MRSAGRVLLMALVVAASACVAEDASSPPQPVGTAPDHEQVLASDDAPNIVVFMTDDQRTDWMVALDRTQARIFDAGATFTTSLVNLPSCCPSRATFLTGQHARNHGVLTNTGVSGGFANFDDQDATLATALEEVGYHTIFVGKYLNGYGVSQDLRLTPPGWRDFRALVSPTEVLYDSPSVWANDILLTYGAADYATDVLTRQAADAIAVTPAAAPIFAWVSYPNPHARAGAPLLGGDDTAAARAAMEDAATPVFLAEPVPAARHLDAFAGHELERDRSFNELDLRDKPSFLNRRLRFPSEQERPRLFEQRALESLLSVDEGIDQLMDLVQAANNRETWFVFTSDNGLLLGEHRQFGAKYYAYEESVRVPLGIAGPGVTPATTIAMPVSNIDLAPTIVDLAGARPPRDADGISLVPYLVGEQEEHGRALLVQGFEFRPSAPPYLGVHTGDSLYVEWATGDRELYDLTVDPFQLDNLADLPESRSLQERSEELLRRLEDCAGRTCHEIGVDLAVPAGQ